MTNIMAVRTIILYLSLMTLSKFLKCKLKFDHTKNISPFYQNHFRQRIPTLVSNLKVSKYKILSPEVTRIKK